MDWMTETIRHFFGPADDASIVFAPSTARHYMQFGESRFELRVDADNGAVFLEPVEECKGGVLRIVGQDAECIGEPPLVLGR